MTEWERINLEYLNHVIRNGLVNIAGLARKIEENLHAMNEAIHAYLEGDVANEDGRNRETRDL